MAELNIVNLEQVLERLNSDETRTAVVHSLVKNGIEVPKKYIERAIEYYEREGDIAAAVDWI